MVTNIERIQANNAELRECIELAENLPDAGSGGDTGGSGGLPSGVLALASGTVTTAEDVTNSLSVTHNLGVTPNFCVWWDTADCSSVVEANMAIYGTSFIKNFKNSPTSSLVFNFGWHVYGYGGSGQLGNSSNCTINTTFMTDTTTTLICTSVYPFKAGHTYRWVCGLVEGIS